MDGLELRRRTMMERGGIILPPGHTRCDWLQSAGTYISTDIFGTHYLDFKIKLKCLELSPSSSDGKGTVFGGRMNYDDRLYQLTTFNKNTLAQGYGHFGYRYNPCDHSQTPAAGFVTGQVQTIRKEGLIFYDANGSAHTLPSGPFTSGNTMPLAVFALAQSSNYSEICQVAQIYDLEFSIRGVTISHLTPAQRDSDGVYGFYDITTHRFLIGAEPEKIIGGYDNE